MNKNQCPWFILSYFLTNALEIHKCSLMLNPLFLSRVHGVNVSPVFQAAGIHRKHGSMLIVNEEHLASNAVFSIKNIMFTFGQENDRDGSLKDNQLKIRPRFMCANISDALFT